MALVASFVAIGSDASVEINPQPTPIPAFPETVSPQIARGRTSKRCGLIHLVYPLKGSSTQIVYALAPKYLYRDHFKAKVYTTVWKWTLRVFITFPGPNIEEESSLVKATQILVQWSGVGFRI